MHFKNIKRKSVLFAALLLCLAFSSCVGFSGDMESRVSQRPALPILVSRGAVELKNISGEASGSIRDGEAVFHSFANGAERSETLEVEKLLAYESPYADASGSYYKNLLQGDMLLPYMAMLYAGDNGFERAYFSSSSLAVEDLYKSYSYLTCDNPFFESNYNIFVEYLTPPEGDTQTPVYYCMYTTVLGESRLEKKLEAYEKAKAIVAALPTGLSEAERAESLYRSVVENTAYTNYWEQNGPARDYLYDALVAGASNCDGFANALAMLFNLSGIDSVLAIGSDEGEGHAWVTAELGGAYYHFDPTYDSETAHNAAYGGKLYYFRMSGEAAFALSRKYDQDIASVAPGCLDESFDALPADMNVEDFTEKESLNAVADALEQDINTDDGCLVVFSSAFYGASWEALADAFNAMTEEVSLNGTVDAFILDDRGFLVLYGAVG